MTNSVEKRCRVCGARAICFNHNGLSCNPCRIFFNRNISRLKMLMCPKQTEKCEIDFATRKCCPKCRMNKCLAIGMSKPVKIKSKLNNLSTQPQIDFANAFEHNILCMIEQTFVTPVPEPNVESQLSINVKCHLELDKNELEHIQLVQKALSVFEDENKLEVISVAQNVQSIFNLPGLYIRRIVKFCKSIPGYKLLGLDDQLVILKQFFFEVFIVRLMFMYDFENNCYYSIADESGNQAILVKKDTLKDMKNIDLLDEAIQHGHSFHLGMQNDVTVRDLVILLYLFQSRDNYSNKEFIRYQYCIYSRLLRRYLEHKYSCIEKATQKHSSLLNSMSTMARVRDIFRILLFEVGQHNLEQVILESFNLN